MPLPYSYYYSSKPIDYDFDSSDSKTLPLEEKIGLDVFYLMRKINFQDQPSTFTIESLVKQNVSEDYILQFIHDVCHFNPIESAPMVTFYFCTPYHPPKYSYSVSFKDLSGKDVVIDEHRFQEIFQEIKESYSQDDTLPFVTHII